MIFNIQLKIKIKIKNNEITHNKKYEIIHNLGSHKILLKIFLILLY